ncbi:mediator of RNA polymerase II transcription subunit 1-like isoform X2 [Archocentrus centrarchus]|uniref:mediator of RNA polymerase II transcription subunit 1-like isoform X2 n=1 Tax=Archocentrus centrarchus TaxID=63155 RepID=UPI0011EA4E7A|nr:mediator of RNA polymerase II transcription subunit 1-like isoform X2 [Archocentrus centrarchus]
MMDMLIIPNLRVKFAEKTWADTFQLVRRCMEKSRDESKSRAALERSLEKLQEESNVCTMNTTKSRLEIIAKQQGMSFHFTEAMCYLSADLFYVEVLLLPSGEVEEVKVVPHGESPVPSESLLQLLRFKNFATFSMKLQGLFAQYSIPGDNELKLKLLVSLQHLGKDLQKISHLPRKQKYSDPEMDMINNGRIGSLIMGKEDCPMTIRFYIPPNDGMKSSASVVQAAQVTVGVSDVTHKLQMASVIPEPPQLDPQGYPVFVPLNEVPNEMLPACFLLKLQPAMPVMLSVVKQLSQITDATVPDVDLQWAPLPKLLMRGSLSTNNQWETSCENKSIFTVPLPGGVIHSYIFPGAAWDLPAHRGAVVDSVPFTHPGHVPALLELLRRQCTINTLLRSCFISQCASPAGLVCGLPFEVLPESDTSFSVTFQPSYADSLSVLLVNVPKPHQITCRLFGAHANDPSINEYLSSVIMSCMSVPETMRMLYNKLEDITSALLSPGRLAATEAENDHSAPSSTAVTDTSRGSAAFSQSAAVPKDSFSVSDSACSAMPVAKSESVPEINESPYASPYPFPPAGMFQCRVGNNGHLSQLI